MQERKITVVEVEAIINAPDGKIPQSRDKSILYKRLHTRSDNLVAAVIVEALPGGVIDVITVLVNFEVLK